MVGDAPPLVHAQHRNLTNRRAVKTAAFLWKPFLFRVLTDIDRVIVLDFDAARSGAPPVAAFRRPCACGARARTRQWRAVQKLGHARVQWRRAAPPPGADARPPVLRDSRGLCRRSTPCSIHLSVIRRCSRTSACATASCAARCLAAGTASSILGVLHTRLSRATTVVAPRSLTHYNQPLLEQLLPALQRREAHRAALPVAPRSRSSRTTRSAVSAWGRRSEFPATRAGAGGHPRSSWGGYRALLLRRTSRGLQPLPVPEGRCAGVISLRS